MEAGQLLGRLLLQFDASAAYVIEDLSAAVISGDGNLWVASDEMGMIERLTPTEPRIYSQHRRFDMADFFGEVERSAEIDIEALDMHADYLWVMGSHSAKRKRPKGKKMDRDLERLATVAHEPQRFLLARIPFVKGELARELKLAGPTKRPRAAARVKPANEPGAGSTGSARHSGLEAPPRPSATTALEACSRTSSG